jgi:hypothetical protein
MRASQAAFERSDFFVSLVLADVQLAAGDAEQACGIALRAITSGEQIRSTRCVSYLCEFGEHLPTGDHGVIAESARRPQAHGSGESLRDGRGLKTKAGRMIVVSFRFWIMTGFDT